MEGRRVGDPISSAPVVGAVWYRFKGDLLLLLVTVSGRGATTSAPSGENVAGLLNCLKWSLMLDGCATGAFGEVGFAGDDERRSITSDGPDVSRGGEKILGLALLRGDEGSGEGRFEDRFFEMVVSLLRSISGIDGALPFVPSLKSSSATDALALNELLRGAGLAAGKITFSFARASIFDRSNSSYSGDLDFA